MACCVMLTRDRPAMARRAVECFRLQTYENKRLLIWDTSDGLCACNQIPASGIMRVPAVPETSIGASRNAASFFASIGNPKPDIFVHFDDDDYSHPNRLAEQVALLQASGADCVGYSDMLFWDTRNCVDITRDQWTTADEAWLYLGPQKALGTSLCYWRATWERKPFPDQPRPGHANGEDTDWIKGLHLAETTSMYHARESAAPRMIASIHGRNTSGSYKLIADSTSWRRAPEWDDYCRERMAL